VEGKSRLLSKNEPYLSEKVISVPDPHRTKGQAARLISTLNWKVGSGPEEDKTRGTVPFRGRRREACAEKQLKNTVSAKGPRGF